MTVLCFEMKYQPLHGAQAGLEFLVSGHALPQPSHSKSSCAHHSTVYLLEMEGRLLEGLQAPHNKSEIVSPPVGAESKVMRTVSW